MSADLKIGVGDEEEAPQRFVEAWHRAERGEPPAQPEERLTFENMETLLRCLTPGRWALLGALRSAGASSVRSLARRLGRDYKNVHSDVALLERLGLISRTDAGEVEVPWASVVAELRLAA